MTRLLHFTDGMRGDRSTDQPSLHGPGRNHSILHYPDTMTAREGEAVDSGIDGQESQLQSNARSTILLDARSDYLYSIASRANDFCLSVTAMVSSPL